MKTDNALPTARRAVVEHFQAEIEELRQRLEEAEETIQAIRTGAVDAFLIDGPEGERVYTLTTADRPYRVMVESMQQGALVLAPDGTVLFANARFADLVKNPHERLIGAALGDYVAADDRPGLAAALQEGRVAGARAELSLQGVDGALVPAHLTINPLPLEGTAALCAIVTDLSEQRQYEELRRAQQALKDADRRKDEFLATLAHELRNPLAPARSAIQILRLDTAGATDRQWAQDVIDRQIQQMARLVDDLLDLSRVTRNQLTLRRERVELAAIIQVAIETSQPLITQGRHELTVTLPSRPVMLDADLTRLAQVFANLLNNAAKFTDDGGRITLSAVEEDGHVVISVRDNGVGIPSEVLPRVFEMFAQFDRSSARSRTGLGIGLALVKKLVELHNGAIEAHSAGPGKGSEFCVRLPRIAELPQAAPEPQASKASTTSRFRLLVVDDNVDSAESLAMVLNLMGNETRTAYDGTTAIEVGRAFQPNVVLLDLGMPKVSGYETCRMLRAQEWGERALVVALTGWGQEGDRRRTQDAGFDLHLVKPVEATAVMELLTRLAADHDAERQGARRSR